MTLRATPLIGFGARRAAAGGISPPPAASLWARFRADEAYSETSGTPTTLITSDGTAIGSLKDLSGNGNHSYQTTHAAKPIFKTNIFNSTLPAFRIAAGDFMSLTGAGEPSDPTGDITVYAVFNRNAATANVALIGSSSATPHFMISDNTLTTIRAYRSNAFSANATIANGTDHMLGVIFDDDDNSCHLKVDDDTQVDTTTGGGNSAATVQIGRYSSGSSWDGDIAELLIYEAQHDFTTGDGLAVRQYLDAYYGLGLGL